MISVKVRLPNTVLSLSIDESSTFEELKVEIAEKGDLDFDFDLLAGFPAKALTLADEDTIHGHIQNNEVLRVQAKELAGQQAQGHSKYRPSKKPNKSAPKASNSSSSSAAAHATSSPAASSSGFGARIATIHSSGAANRRPAAANNSRAISGISGPSGGLGITQRRQSSARQRQSRSIPVADAVTSESDIADHLVSAVSGGGAKRDKVLRKVFRNAVEHQYSSSKAVARLHAVYSGQYRIQPLATSRILGSGLSSQMEVTFTRGAGNRGEFTETVDLLGEEVLKELLKLALQDGEDGKEVLKPMNLSRCSPRIFWSLVHRYGNNLIQSIRSLLTGVDDCTWLTERKKELSEKAKENAEQERVRQELAAARKRKRTGADENPSVSLPTSTSTKKTRTTKESKVQETEETQNAAMSSDDVLFLGSSPSAAVTVLNPTQQNAKIVRLVSGKPIRTETLALFASLTLTTIVPSDCHDQLVALLQSFAPGGASILTLACIASAEQLCEQLTTTASTPSTSTSSSSMTRLSVCSEEQVECWITAAQQTVLQHLWSLICGGGSERLRLAFKKLRIRNPRELLLWKTAVSGLHNGLLQIDQGLSSIPFFWAPSTETSSSSSSSSSISFKGHGLSIESLQWTLALSEEVQSSWPWLNQYSVLVDDEDSDAVAEEDETSWDDAWETSATAHVYLGQTCRVLVRGDAYCDNEDDDADEEVGGRQDIKETVPLLPPGSFWEDGEVVAYLPATEEEPMALWRILLQEASPSSTNSKSSKSTQDVKKRYEDMEAHEVAAALRRYAMKTSGVPSGTLKSLTKEEHDAAL